jgi:hypothetical protein
MYNPKRIIYHGEATPHKKFSFNKCTPKENIIIIAPFIILFLAFKAAYRGNLSSDTGAVNSIIVYLQERFLSDGNFRPCSDRQKYVSR